MFANNPTNSKVSVSRNNEEIFDKELLPHIDALKTFAFHLAFNENDANDLVQETYMKAYRFIDKYHQGTNAKAWFCLLYTSPSPRDQRGSRMPSSA